MGGARHMWAASCPSWAGDVGVVWGVFRLWAVVVLRGHWVVRRGGAVVYMVGPGSWATQLVRGQRIIVVDAGSWVGDAGVVWGVFRWWAVVVLRGCWVVSRGGAVVHMVGAGSWAVSRPLWAGVVRGVWPVFVDGRWLSFMGVEMLMVGAGAFVV